MTSLSLDPTDAGMADYLMDAINRGGDPYKSAATVSRLFGGTGKRAPLVSVRNDPPGPGPKARPPQAAPKPAAEETGAGTKFMQGFAKWLHSPMTQAALGALMRPKDPASGFSQGFGQGLAYQKNAYAEAMNNEDRLSAKYLSEEMRPFKDAFFAKAKDLLAKGDHQGVIALFQQMQGAPSQPANPAGMMGSAQPPAGFYGR